jgi:hypothetical protein
VNLSSKLVMQRPIARCSDRSLTRWPIGQVNEDVEMFVYTPPGVALDAATGFKHPCLLWIHGGPVSQARPKPFRNQVKQRHVGCTVR